MAGGGTAGRDAVQGGEAAAVGTPCVLARQGAAGGQVTKALHELPSQVSASSTLSGLFVQSDLFRVSDEQFINYKQFRTIRQWISNLCGCSL